MGFSQHDSQELLSILLETLHEDLNQVTSKPYVEYNIPESQKSEEKISQIYWQGFQKREKSIFVDMFYGQLKSSLQCTKCGYNSTTFDTFNMLSLPVPTQTNLNIVLKYIGYNFKQSPIEFKLTVSEYTTLYELQKRLQEYFQQELRNDNYVLPFITVLKQSKDNRKFTLEVLNDEKFVKSIVQSKEDQIVVYQREPLESIGLLPDESQQDLILLEIKQMQLRSNYLVFS